MTKPTSREIAFSVGMFVVTLVTVSAAWVLFWGGGETLTDPRVLREAAIFAGCLMSILLAHEMGHYVVARRHGFALSLPLFVPFPNPFGTMGAIIRLRSLPRSRQALLEMGVAGPLAGATLSFLALAVALRWTRPGPPLEPGQTYLVLADPLVVRVLGTLVLGAPPERTAIFHPAALAGWIGCFVTGLNLLPVGQLDGGHVLNAAFPRVAPYVSRIGPILLLAAGYWWAGWAVWGVLLLILSAGRPLPVAEHPPLPIRPRVLAALAVVVFVLTFLPVPMVEESIGP